MHYGQNRVTQRTLIKPKRPKLNENRGKFLNFAEIGGEIPKFCRSRREYAICIIDLGGMDAPVLLHLCSVTFFNFAQLCSCSFINLFNGVTRLAYFDTQ